MWDTLFTFFKAYLIYSVIVLLLVLFVIWYISTSVADAEWEVVEEPPVDAGVPVENTPRRKRGGRVR